MKLIDTHCHLNATEFLGNIEEYLTRAKEAGVHKMIVVGCDEETSLKAIELAEKYPCLFAAVGFHPNDLHHIQEEQIEKIAKLLTHPRVVAVGEIGLDYYYHNNLENKKLQKDFFKKQIVLANHYQLPIIVHCREAIQDTLSLLQEEPPLFGGVMHCYAGSKEMIGDFTGLGLLISLGGVVTFKNARVSKEVAAAVPLSHLLLETDCPYLAPNPYRGQINEPAYVKLVAEEIAKLRNIEVEELAFWTSQNAERLFKI